VGYKMEVMLLAGDHRATLDAALAPFGWRTTGRRWPQAEGEEIPTNHELGLVGVNFGRNWTVIHDTEVCFVDELYVAEDVAKAANADVLMVSVYDVVGLQSFAYATPAGLRRQVNYVESELDSDEGEPLFVVPLEDLGDDGEPSFPEAHVLRMLDHVLGFDHEEIVVPDHDPIEIVEITRVSETG